jgi:hypothetical protein
MQHCPHCNYEVEAPQKFCTKCGGRLRTDEDFADATTRTLPLPAGTTKRMDPCAASDLKPVVEWKIAPMPDDSAGIDYYDFNVSLNNAGETIYRNDALPIFRNIVLSGLADERARPASRVSFGISFHLLNCPSLLQSTTNEPSVR